MTLVTPSLVLSTVSTRYTSIHIRLTYLLSSTMSSAIRVKILMMLVSSTAHMFLSKWFVPLVRTPSSLRLASRPVMEWLQTHSLRVLAKVQALSVLTLTVTTEEYKLPTSCESLSDSFRPPQGGLFLSKYLKVLFNNGISKSNCQ
jgi:hypothetical protein